MFTGLIEETGTVASATPRGGIVALTIRARAVMEGLAIDDSVNINGVCQTVVNLTNDAFTVQAVKETLRKTTLGSLRAGHSVNLERAILPSTRMGGHFVQGHVDGTGTVASIRRNPGDWQIRISMPERFMKYIIPMGSICVDGVSLTVASVEKNEIMVAVIPHTLEVTTLKDLKPGTDVNLELDMIGKYVVGLIERMGTRVLR